MKYLPRWIVLCLTLGSFVRAEPPAPQAIDFTTETLPNGLRVIYAPLHQAPVVHVRVLYHVGSKDERPDRQGFAHMFEHMMFRGSAHVPPEQHMKLIGVVGGYSNAFTSFDQTVYVNTVPADHLDMALYLEADRMASFKVSEDIYKTERKVVAEEWRMRMNKPYGSMYEDFLKNAFTTHHYRWTPIGNMDHLRAAAVGELQDFFNTYYLPNNAVLVIAGDFDLNATKEMVKKYYGWIPRGPEVKRDIPREPEQKEARRATVPQRVPLPALMIGYPIPEYKSDDHYPLAILSSILSAGQSGRLDKLLVDGESPTCVSAYAAHYNLEDGGFFGVGATVMQGKSPAEVEKIIVNALEDVKKNGVTPEELLKAKVEARVELIHERETAEKLAEQLGSEALFADDPNRVNTEAAKLGAVTADDVKAVANKYLTAVRSTTLLIQPDPLGTNARKAATGAAMDTPVVQSTQPVAPRAVVFPEDYPTQPPLAAVKGGAVFNKGIEKTINGVRVIVMNDPRLPTVNWSLTMRRGAHSDPKGKEGLASLTADMLRRGAADLSYEQLNEDLESRGISLGVSDGSDFTRLGGSCTTDQLDHAVLRSRQVLLQPTFPADEFAKFKEQTINHLKLAQESPASVAGNDLADAIWGDTPLGRHATPASISAITLDDVKKCYEREYRPGDAVLVFSGDITVEKGEALANQLLDGWKRGELPVVDYTPANAPVKRKIILVDRPEGQQATVQMAVRAYDIRSDEKYAGSVANQILTAGIDSRLGKYVRAEKGLAYGVHGVFQPTRHGGTFMAGTDTKVETAADAVEAIFKVLSDMRDGEVTDKELAESKTRVAGSMVMQMQTMAEQAQYRVDGILNNYPVDYYDLYPERVAGVTKAQVREVMRKYVHPEAMVIVVVAPASAVKEQLQRLGDVQIIPMPAKRQALPDAQPEKKDLLKPAA